MALAFIASHPGQNFYGKEVWGDASISQRFTPICRLPPAASTATTENLGYPSIHHQVGDALGGLVVRVPLEF